MLEINNVFTQIYAGVSESLAAYGFAPEFPEGVKKSEAPIWSRGQDEILLNFAGEKGKLRVLYTGGKIFLLSAEAEAIDDDDSDFSRIATYLLDLEEYGDKDVKFIITEFCETINENFGKKQLNMKRNGGKGPVPVSRSAAKSGALSYDSNTLANRLATNYPELKDAYKENIDNFGEFLPEDFFTNHGNAVIHQIIKENNSQKVKKLFTLLNEIYSDGTNEVQSLIIVTILGSVKNDPDMMKIILDNISDIMMEPVIYVNEILAKSKGANMRLDNPPQYKPKAKKSGGIMSALGLG